MSQSPDKKEKKQVIGKSANTASKTTAKEIDTLTKQNQLLASQLRTVFEILNLVSKEEEVTRFAENEAVKSLRNNLDIVHTVVLKGGVPADQTSDQACFKNLENSFHKYLTSITTGILKGQIKLGEVENKLNQVNHDPFNQSGRKFVKLTQELTQDESFQSYSAELIGKTAFDEGIDFEEIKALMKAGAQVWEFSKQMLQTLDTFCDSLPLKLQTKQPEDTPELQKRLLGCELIEKKFKAVFDKVEYCGSYVQMMHKVSSKELPPLIEDSGLQREVFGVIRANLEDSDNNRDPEFVSFLGAWEEAMVLNFDKEDKHLPLEVYIAMKRSSECFMEQIKLQIEGLESEVEQVRERAKGMAKDLRDQEIQKEKEIQAEKERKRLEAEKEAKRLEDLEKAKLPENEAAGQKPQEEGAAPNPVLTGAVLAESHHSTKPTQDATAHPPAEGPTDLPADLTAVVAAEPTDALAAEETHLLGQDSDEVDTSNVIDSFKDLFRSLKTGESRDILLSTSEYTEAQRLAQAIQELETRLEQYKINTLSNLGILEKDCQKYFKETVQGAEGWGIQVDDYTPKVLMDNIYVRRWQELDNSVRNRDEEIGNLNEKNAELDAQLKDLQELSAVERVNKKQLEQELQHLRTTTAALQAKNAELASLEEDSRRKSQEALNKYSVEVQNYATLKQQLLQEHKDLKQKIDEKLEILKREQEAQDEQTRTLEQHKKRQDIKDLAISARMRELEQLEKKSIETAGTSRLAGRQAERSRSPSPVPGNSSMDSERTIEHDHKKNKKELDDLRRTLVEDQNRWQREKERYEILEEARASMDQELKKAQQKSNSFEETCKRMGEDITNLKKFVSQNTLFGSTPFLLLSLLVGLGLGASCMHLMR